MKYEIKFHFNIMLSSGDFEPSWHMTIFRMLPKDGDLSKESNWRPIAILPILYKAFARLLYNRISPPLLSAQSWDQHAFTSGIRIEDALVCAEMAIEYALEFNSPLWIMSMDLRKAFDTVDHEALFEALLSHGLEDPYI